MITPTASALGTASKGRVMLAYSGGLDTSCILAWLLEQGFEVYAYMADIGQEEDFAVARAKALALGAAGCFVEDLRDDFVRETIFPVAVWANCLYEGVYFLGTALARPVIARRQIELAKEHGCAYVAHGCTGKGWWRRRDFTRSKSKLAAVELTARSHVHDLASPLGNDQVRFELAYYALAPEIEVIAPWRDPTFFNRFQGRQDLLDYAAVRGIPVTQTRAKPWSTDENLFHISFEAGILEDPGTTPPKDMWKLTVDPEDAPDVPERIKIYFKKGTPVQVENLNDGQVKSSALDLFLYLNALARKHGVGRIDIVENRFIGIKSRGCYETPAGTVLRAAHMDLEGLTMDREVRRLRDTMSARLAEIVYNGFWFAPEREFVMKSIEWSQNAVDGVVQVKLYKGSVTIEGRWSSVSLYDSEMSSMDIAGGFNPSDSDGFIRVQSLRLKKWVEVEKKRALNKGIHPGGAAGARAAGAA